MRSDASRAGNFEIGLSGSDVEVRSAGNATVIASSVNENGRACTMLMDLNWVSIRTSVIYSI
jgi:hypothetical protein